MTNDNTQKMLRMIINGQSSMKSELQRGINDLKKRLEKVEDKVDAVEIRLTKRIDKLGMQITKLEEDAPTVKEFDKLEESVSVLEQNFA